MTTWRSAALVSGLLLAGGVCAAENDRTDPLFASDDVLNLTFTAPFADLSQARDANLRRPGRLTYAQADGSDRRLEVGVEVRGKNRLKRSTCRFPPLRVVFGSDTPDTLFAGQDDLKLVTQCDPTNANYRRYIANEYLAYRIFNLITPMSFRVRLARIDYTDVDRANTHEQLGFFIEDKRRLARRIGAEHLKIAKTSAIDLDQMYLNQMSLFELLIGNVDYSATSGGTDECCHNTKLFAQTDGAILSIPYDFDLSGLVDAKYARPDVDMGLRSVRDRRYRGYCRNNSHLPDSIALFNARRAAIVSLIESTGELTPAQRAVSIRYVESFYELINDPKRVERTILQSCHKSIFVEVDS